MVPLELYRVFHEVATAGSFSQAAQRLYVSQSAVSQSIAQLERLVGRRLLERSRRGVALTPEGKLLYEHVHSALGIISTGEERLERMRHLQEGELSIGAGDTISKHFLLSYLASFQSQYPGVKLQVWNRTSSQALELLRSGRVELAFANLPIQAPDLEVVPCLQVHDIFVASSKFAPLQGRALSWEELSQLPLVMLETMSNSRRYVDAFATQQGVQLRPEIELGAHDLLLEFARVGLGVACVIGEFSDRFLQTEELFALHLKRPVPSRSVGLCTMRGMTPSFAAQRFMELVLQGGGAACDK